jgi:hypothetical protein
MAVLAGFAVWALVCAAGFAVVTADAGLLAGLTTSRPLPRAVKPGTVQRGSTW